MSAELVTTESAEKVRFAKDLLDRARAEIAYAENKASILLAGTLAAVGGITAAISGSGWDVLRQPAWLMALFWAAVLAALGAIAGLAWAIYPRIVPQDAARPLSVGFFGDVAAMESPARLRTLLLDPGTTIFGTWVDQIWQSSLIADRRYRIIRWSIRLLGCAVLIGVATLLAAMAHTA